MLSLSLGLFPLKLGGSGGGGRAEGNLFRPSHKAKRTKVYSVSLLNKALSRISPFNSLPALFVALRGNNIGQ